MKFNIKPIQLPHRLKLEYVEHGDRNGVPVILLHGITDSWRSFELVLPHLPKSVRAFALEFQKSTLAQPIPEGYLETVVRESMKLPARVWRAAFQNLMKANLFNELDKIIAPTLIIWGDQDTYFLREEQDALAARIADSKLVVYNGAGHALHWEEPQRFAADLLAFIEKR